jgi:PQQ-like domain
LGPILLASTIAAAAAPVASAGLLPPPSSSSPPPVVAPAPPGPETDEYGYDAAHDFAAVDPSLRPPLETRWSIPLPGDNAFTGLLADDGLDFLLVTESAHDTRFSRLTELRASDGRTVWSRAIPFSSSLAYQDGVVAATANTVPGGVAGYSAATGATLWQLSQYQGGYVAAADGDFYATGQYTQYNGQFLAIDGGSGKVIWNDSMPLAPAGPPGIAGDRVYASASVGWEAFNRLTGAVLWQHDIGSGPGVDSATLWGDELFRVNVAEPDLPGGLESLPESGAAVSDATGDPVGGAAGEVVADSVAWAGEMTAAYSLTTNARLWEAALTPLAAINDDGLGFYAHALEQTQLKLVSLTHGHVLWQATVNRTPPLDAAPVSGTAVGNGELLIASPGRLTALVPLGRGTRPTVRLRFVDPFAVYGRTAASITGRISEPSITTQMPFGLASARFPFKHATRPAPHTTTPTGQFGFRLGPTLNTIYALTVPQLKPIYFEVIALPRVRFSFGGVSGNRRRVTVTYSVPPAVKLGHRLVGLYIGRARSKRYELLGTGRLSGGRGTYRATFTFGLLRSVGPHDFLATCAAGLYKEGMELSDPLDRRCGAPVLRF